MSDRNDNSSLQGIFSQVLREIQSGINRLEQTVNQTVQNQQRPGGGFGGVEEVTPAQTESAPPKTPPPPYNGARFEYKVVYVNFRGQLSSEGEQIMIGRGERRSTFVREYLDDLGQQGWELSGVSPLGETENSYFIFKRPSTGEARSTASNTSTTRAGRRVQVEEVDENNPVAQL